MPGQQATTPDRPAAPWLRRPLLVERVAQAAAAGGVVLLAAEPGSGKSVLLRQWLVARGAGGVTWLEAGEHDDLAQALSALRRRGAVLVVDDTHALGPEQLVALGGAAAERATGSALVLSGRREHALPMAELAAAGPVVALDGDDLAFTPEEVARVLTLGGRRCSDDDVDAVAWASEGWCAGVRLAAAIGPQVLVGEDAVLVHHLLAALDHAPAELRDAVVRLAVAATFDAATVQAALEPPQGGAVLLRELRAHRLFVRAAWGPHTFRLHRLFRAAALARLQAGPPAATLALHERVACHALGGTAGGIVVGSEHDETLTDAMAHDELLAAHAVDLLLDARLAPPSAGALAAAAAAPAAVRAGLELALLAVGDAVTARRMRQGAAPDGEADLVPALLRARHAGDLPAATAAAHRIAQAGGEGGHDALAWLELGTLEHDLGDAVAAEPHLLLAAARADHTGRPALAARAWATLAEVSCSTGGLRAAARHVAAAVAAYDPLPPEAAVRVAIARSVTAYQANDLASAASGVQAARRAAGPLRDPVLWFTVLLWEVVTLEAGAEDGQAAACIAEAQDVLARCPYPPPHAASLDLYRARLLDRAGRTAEADALVGALAANEYPATDLVIARRRLRGGDAEGSIAALRPRLDEAHRERRQLTVWHLITYAIALDQLGDGVEAHAAIEEALDLSVAEGLVRPFVEDAHRAHPLLTRHASGPTRHAAFVAEILDHLRDARPAPEATLTSPLTDRELMVLGYLPSAMTAADVADALTVSESTVRTHLRHIYEKLGAEGRRDAVRRARELGLLAPHD